MYFATAVLVFSASLVSAVSVPAISLPSGLSPLQKIRAEGAKRFAPRGCSSSVKAPANVPSVTFEPYDAAKAEVYRYRMQQSVNLGNWFAHEAWMGDDAYQCATGPKTAEIDIAGGSNARNILENNWATWITADDFKEMASLGINTVRIPMGFWTLGPQWCKNSIFADYADEYTNSYAYFKNAVKMAADNGIGVLVDLHGAYGSQNGQAHSGVSDGKANLFNSQSDQDQTVNVLVQMMKDWANVNNVVGIQLLNEPNNAGNLPDFYTRAIEAMRAVDVTDAKTFPLYIHDGFNIGQYSKFVGQRDDFTVVDHHSYFVFQSSMQNTPVTQLASQIKSSVSDNIASNTKTARGNLVVDEWGCALADGSTHVSDLSGATKTYCENQHTAYTSGAAGWAFWAWKLAGCKKGDGNGWCFYGAVGAFLPDTFFSFPSQTTLGQTLASTGGSSSNSTSSNSGNDNNSGDNVGDEGSSASVSATGSSAATATVTASGAASTQSGKSCKAASRKRSAHAKRRHHQRAVENGHNVAASAKRHHARGSSSSSSSSSGKSAAYNTCHDAATTFAVTGSRIGFAKQFAADKGLTGNDVDDCLSAIGDAEQTAESNIKKRNARRAASS